MHPAESNLNNPGLTAILFAILVRKLGGEVLITQQDIDAVAYNRLIEEGKEDGSIRFELVTRRLAS